MSERVFRVRRECRVEKTEESVKVNPRDKFPRVTLVRDTEVTPDGSAEVTSLPLRPQNNKIPERKASLNRGRKAKVISGKLAKSMSTPELNSIYQLCGEMNDLKNDLGKENKLDLANRRLRSSPRLNAEVTRKSLKRGLNFDHETNMFDENRLVPLDFDERKLLEKCASRSENAKKRRKRSKTTKSEESYSVPEKYLEPTF